MKTFSALEPLLQSVPAHWKVAAMRRVLALSERPNSDSQAELLSLHSSGKLAPRREDSQAPSLEYLPRYWLVEPGDLVVNPMWLAGGGVGVSTISGAVSPDYRVYQLGSFFEPRYIHYLLRSAPYFAQYRLLMRAETTFDRRVTKEDFRELPILAPPLPTQRAIADYLDRETERIDAVIEKKKQMVQLLNDRWRSEATQLIASYSSEVGTIPLRRVMRCLDGRRIPLSAEERATRQGPYPYYGASTVLDWIDDYIFDEELVLVGEDGAQLGDPSYPIAQRASGKIWVNNHAHVIRPLRIDPDLLVFYLNTFDRMPFVSGATREKLTQGDLGRIPVPAGEREQQSAIAQELVRSRVRSEGLTVPITRQLALLEEHRQALITTAVTGGLDLAVAA